MAGLEEEPGLRGRFMFRMAMMEMIITSSAAAAAMPSIFSCRSVMPSFSRSWSHFEPVTSRLGAVRAASSSLAL